MYEFDWADRGLWAREAPVVTASSRLHRDRVMETLLVHWQEHCIECAPPHCYSTCPLYVERGDARCARFVYGVHRNAAVEGLFDSGADVRFRRWAKIETRLFGRGVSVSRHRALDRADAAATRVVGAASTALLPLTRRRRLTASWASRRESLLARIGSPSGRYDDFVLECHVASGEHVRLVLEKFVAGGVRFRHAFDLVPGHNFTTVPADRFGDLGSGRLRLYPDGDAEPRVVFTWLDFVRYGDSVLRPAEKVKVVAWDLDRTLWYGTLLEDGDDGCRLRDGVRETIAALDARGILQTIVSKNDHDHAWDVVGRLGLQDYFLHPAINWGQKSQNLRQVAESLNLGLDAFAVIDDSPFERAEIESALPMVRVYDETVVASLLRLPEFDVPVTEMSAQRRLSYQAEAERGRVKEQFGGDYTRFLRECELRVRAFKPVKERETLRCLELVQRSNQLNLSGRRYSTEEFTSLLSTPGVLTTALEAEDRFGHYGIIGFAAIDERPETPIVRDFVLSCRIAGKHVEQTFFRWLAAYERERGAVSLRAELHRTQRNRPLVRMIEELPFVSVGTEDERELLEMGLDNVAVDDLIEFRSEV